MPGAGGNAIVKSRHSGIDGCAGISTSAVASQDCCKYFSGAVIAAA
jgi:hypothetical protein